uniref:Cilia- and flagella-associated protein 36 n=1 Tax=Meloidogyne incognita TaxID=6306 RepID=A0A914KTL0_MELIC
MSEKDQNKLFDSFMEFLRSDLWQIPVSQFIEQRSIVFEREPDLGSSPNTIESFQAVHSEFAKMISDLIKAYCADSNQNREGVMETLKIAHREKFQQMSNKDKMLLEPIVASEHFDVFVPMMMRKNIELQLQALKMIEVFNALTKKIIKEKFQQHMKGLLPSSLLLGEEDAKLWEALDAEEQDESEKLILLAVLRQSKEEWEYDQRMRADSEGQMERALRESLAEKTNLEEMRRKEQLLLEKALSEKFTNLSIYTKTDETTKNFKLNLPPSVIFQNTSIPTINEDNIKNCNDNEIIINEEIKELEQQRGISPNKEKPGTSQSADIVVSMRSPDSKSGRSSQMSLPVKAEKTRVVRSVSSKQEIKSNEETDTNENDKTSKNNENNIKNSSESTNKKRRSLGQVHQPPRGKDKSKDGNSNKNSDLAYRSLLKKRDDIPDENIQSRMHYLREQRDKLLQKKSIERQKQLLATNDNSRPKTAKAARGLMAQNESSELEERRRIAAKIKAEVIDKHQPQSIGQI